MDKTIMCNVMKELGVPANLLGHEYIITAVALCAKDRGYIRAITKKLYPEIATCYDTTPSRVERAIRHAIEVSFNRIPLDCVDKVFGCSVDPNKGKPANGQYIAAITDYYKSIC